MGKTTLYHPVSLHVIRGAAEYCGFKFGKIVQTTLDDESRYARYTAELTIIPLRMERDTDLIILNELRDCFLDDITPHWLRRTKSGTFKVDLVVKYPAPGDVDLSWLVDDTAYDHFLDERPYDPPAPN